MINEKKDIKNQEELPLEEKPKRKTGKKSRKETFSRKPIVILFLITIVIPLLLLLVTRLSKIWTSFETSDEVVYDETYQAKSKEEVISKVLQTTRDLQGNYGFYVYDFDTNTSYGSNFHKTFKTGLCLKLPLMLSFFFKSEKEGLDLETVYLLSDEDKSQESGVLWAKPEGERLTYLKLLEILGQYSDSTAVNVLQKRIGKSAIEEMVSKLNLKQTNISALETTPRDLGLLLKQAYATDFLSDKGRDTFFKFLTNSALEKRIPRLLPKEVKVSHLESTEANSFADAGIVFKEKPFVIVIIANGAKEQEARDIIPEIAKLIWEFESSKNF